MTTGMNAATGRAITDWDHVQQSIGKVMSTALRSRAMRRDFGSAVPRLTDGPLSPVTLITFYSAMAKAILFEPRFKAKRIVLEAMDSGGQAVFRIDGTYYPNALAGDFSVKQSASATVTV